MQAGPEVEAPQAQVCAWRGLSRRQAWPRRPRPKGLSHRTRNCGERSPCREGPGCRPSPEPKGRPQALRRPRESERGKRKRSIRGPPIGSSKPGKASAGAGRPQKGPKPHERGCATRTTCSARPGLDPACSRPRPALRPCAGLRTKPARDSTCLKRTAPALRRSASPKQRGSLRGRARTQAPWPGARLPVHPEGFPGRGSDGKALCLRSSPCDGSRLQTRPRAAFAKGYGLSSPPEPAFRPQGGRRRSLLSSGHGERRLHREACGRSGNRRGTGRNEDTPLRPRGRPCKQVARGQGLSRPPRPGERTRRPAHPLIPLLRRARRGSTSTRPQFASAHRLHPASERRDKPCRMLRDPAGLERLGPLSGPVPKAPVPCGGRGNPGTPESFDRPRGSPGRARPLGLLKPRQRGRPRTGRLGVPPWGLGSPSQERGDFCFDRFGCGSPGRRALREPTHGIFAGQEAKRSHRSRDPAGKPGPQPWRALRRPSAGRLFSPRSLAQSGPRPLTPRGPCEPRRKFFLRSE